MKLLCTFIGHKFRWIAGDVLCRRCGKHGNYDQFMNKHREKSMSVRFRW